MKSRFEFRKRSKLGKIDKSEHLVRRKEKALLTAVTTIAWCVNNDDNHYSDEINQEQKVVVWQCLEQ